MAIDQQNTYRFETGIDLRILIKSLDCNLLKLIAKDMRLVNVQMNNVAPKKERKCNYTDNQNIYNIYCIEGINF
jgi:hypothetical protein